LTQAARPEELLYSSSSCKRSATRGSRKKILDAGFRRHDGVYGAFCYYDTVLHAWESAGYFALGGTAALVPPTNIIISTRFENDTGVNGYRISPGHNKRVDINLLNCRAGCAEIAQPDDNSRHCLLIDGCHAPKTL